MKIKHTNTVAVRFNPGRQALTIVAAGKVHREGEILAEDPITITIELQGKGVLDIAHAFGQETADVKTWISPGGRFGRIKPSIDLD
ncbi:hypothetical protein JXB02_04910 [Candidatus Woesearchaeota archaeon]|nr:hypothetical protein [Candidatus Woesearchaeota archaeon]